MNLESDAAVTHSAFGLHYRSRMPWLPAPRLVDDCNADVAVQVSFDAATPALDLDTHKLTRFEALPGQFWFRTCIIADYLVQNGRQVRIIPKHGADPTKLANLLFGAVTGGLLIQRGQLALHGCTVETPGGAVLFCGDSGAGKSTLAALLLARGLRVLDDNIAALQQRDDGFWVQPGLGHLRLTGDTLALLAQTAKGPAFAAPYEIKYLHPLDAAEFCHQPRQLRHIFWLDRSHGTFLQNLSGPAKLALIQRHVFLRQMVAPLGQLKGHFQSCLALAASIPVSRLGYPPGAALGDWVEEIFKLVSSANIKHDYFD
nr:hypothetical protein [uncultured Rhodoferax sp.]